MKVEIRNRWSGEIQFTAEVDCAKDASIGIKIGLAVRWAYKNSADLTDADLTGADLTGAYLTGADLTGAYLTGADLTGAVLRDADLRGADLRDADLRGADLRGADLRDADLRGADLRDADLRDADLRGADLRDADLRGADLTPIRDDLWAVLSAAPREAQGLADALRAGKVDGSTYQGECACLVGTIANSRGCDVQQLGALKPNSNRPIERFFMSIRPGDTPDKNQFTALALEWTEEWIGNMRGAFKDSVDAPL